MNMEEVRKKFPQYNDLSDADLAQALHKKFYSDIPFDKFATQIGLSRDTADPLGSRPQPTAPATLDQKVTASYPMRVARGITDSVDAGAQYLPWALGAVTGGFGLAPNKVSDFFFSESDRVSKKISEQEKGYQDARRAVSGDVGFDSARMSGNVVSPVNALLTAAGAPLPATVGGRAVVGGLIGSTAAMTTPVYNTDSTKLGGEKATQAAVGGAVGAVATPAAAKAAEVLGKGLDRIVVAVNRWRGKQQTVPDQIIINTIRSELARENISLDDVPETILRSVKAQVNDALKYGQKVDAAAIVRQADFETVGTRGTLGQITRDPVQFTREQNLRGVQGAGDDLARRFNEQRQAFGQVFSRLGADKADDAYPAAERLTRELAAYDAPVKARVDAAYQAVRDSAGRPAPMNTAQFSQQANRALDQEMLGGNLPSEARTLLNKISTGEIPLDVQTQIKVRERLGGIAADQYRAGNRQAGLAVQQVINALDATDVVAPGGAQSGLTMIGAGSQNVPGPVNAGAQTLEMARQARALATQRFDTIKANPALKAFLEGDVNMDQFVNKYVINGKTDDLVSLSKILRPEGKDVVRQQLASQLERAAFGTNRTNDSKFAIEQYNALLDKMGRAKLLAFFTPEEVDKLYAVGRAAAWAGKEPAGGAVNWSNTAAAAMNLFSQIKGASIAIPMSVIRPAQNSITISRGLAAQPPTQPIPILSPALRELVPAVPVAAGVTSAGLLSYQ